MAKYINNKIKSGRVAGSVYAVRFGEVIERAYNPFVSNPNTPAQVAQRAKMKLLSQLSAVIAPAIAIPRDGAISPRNLFTKLNYGKTSYADDQANITLTEVQLTKSAVALAPLVATRSAGSISVSTNVAELELDRVVYVAVAKEADNKMRYINSTVVEKDAQSIFAAQISVSDTIPVVLYAYGIRFNTDAARAVFGELTAETAETIAKVIVSRTVKAEDITLTETRGAEIAAV